MPGEIAMLRNIRALYTKNKMRAVYIAAVAFMSISFSTVLVLLLAPVLTGIDSKIGVYLAIAGSLMLLAAKRSITMDHAIPAVHAITYIALGAAALLLLVI